MHEFKVLHAADSIFHRSQASAHADDEIEEFEGDDDEMDGGDGIDGSVEGMPNNSSTVPAVSMARIPEEEMTDRDRQLLAREASLNASTDADSDFLAAHKSDRWRAEQPVANVSNSQMPVDDDPDAVDDVYLAELKRLWYSQSHSAAQRDALALGVSPEACRQWIDSVETEMPLGFRSDFARKRPEIDEGLLRGRQHLAMKIVRDQLERMKAADEDEESPPPQLILLLYGTAGTGKSLTSDALAQMWAQEGDCGIVTATSGMVASQRYGTTAHKFFKIPVDNKVRLRCYFLVNRPAHPFSFCCRSIVMR
jgi:hypothetical protein